MATKSEKNKQIIAAVLGVLLVGVIVYQIFFSSPTPRPSANTNRNSNTTSQRGSAPIPTPETAEKVANKQPVSQNNQEAELQELLSDSSPLNLGVFHEGSKAEVSSRGNIFDFFVQPPKPPPPPPPPPPITLRGVSPNSATAGVPRPFTLTVYSKPVSVPDVQIFIDGRPHQTKKITDESFSTEISPGDYAYARNMNIELKSVSDPKQFSNPLNFIVTQAPDPPFKFIGLLGDQAILEMNGTKDIVRMKTGQTVQGLWHIDSISTQGVDVTHIQFDIKRRVPLQEKTR